MECPRCTQVTAKPRHYQSPDYVEHLAKMHGDSVFLVIVQENDGKPIGIATTQHRQASLNIGAAVAPAADRSSAVKPRLR
jgi:hypothetical protein